MTMASDDDITNDDLQEFLRAVIARIAAGDDYPTFIARGLFHAHWILKLDEALPGADTEGAMRRSMVLNLLREVWTQTPDPANRFVPPSLPPLERNAPCFCGSLRKYKHCCLRAAQAAPMDDMFLLPLLLDALPRTRWPTPANSRLGVAQLAATAHGWMQAFRAKDVRALLEPWLADDGHLTENREVLFDLLLDAYSELGMPRKKTQLLERALAAGDRTLRSAAMQRRVTMLSDKGDYAGAWALFREAQRHEPDSPSLSHLEIVLLVSEGRDAEARERARFLALRLGARRDPDLQWLVGFLRDVAEHGGAALGQVVASKDPVLGPLLDLLAKAPAPASHYTLSPDGASAGPLEPTPALRKALAAWDKACPTLEDAPFDLSGTMYEGEDPTRLRVAPIWEWMPVLERFPILWNAFEVLDAVIDMAMQNEAAGLSDALERPLLDRAAQVLDAVLHANGADGLHLEWAWLQNRTVLQLLGYRAQLDLGEPCSPATIARLERLLALNPTDNHGFRSELVLRYIELGRFDDAIALADRYPNDYSNMRYSRALALFCAGRLDEASTALRDAVAVYPHPRTWLLKARAAPPREPGPGVRVGGEKEAYVYRERALPLWRRSGALDWLRETKAPRGKR